MSALANPEQFAKLRFLNKEIDQNTNFAKSSFYVQIRSFLQVAQLLIKADPLVNIVSTWLRNESNKKHKFFTSALSRNNRKCLARVGVSFLASRTLAADFLMSSDRLGCNFLLNMSEKEKKKQWILRISYNTFLERYFKWRPESRILLSGLHLKYLSRNVL